MIQDNMTQESGVKMSAPNNKCTTMKCDLEHSLHEANQKDSNLENLTGFVSPFN